MVFVYNLNMFMEVKNLQSTLEVVINKIELVTKSLFNLIEQRCAFFFGNNVGTIFNKTKQKL